MSDLYNRIEMLCKQAGKSVTTVCRESGASRASLSDLKAGRKQSLSAETLSRLADHLGVTVDYLLSGAEKAPALGSRTPSDDEIKFALFGGDGEITDAMFEEVRSFAAYVKQREAQKKKE